jgi:hypothetical protein
MGKMQDQDDNISDQPTLKKKVEEKKKSDEAPKSLRDMLMGAK